MRVLRTRAAAAGPGDCILLRAGILSAASHSSGERHPALSFKSRGSYRDGSRVGLQTIARAPVDLTLEIIDHPVTISK